ELSHARSFHRLANDWTPSGPFPTPSTGSIRHSATGLRGILSNFPKSMGDFQKDCPGRRECDGRFHFSKTPEESKASRRRPPLRVQSANFRRRPHPRPPGRKFVDFSQESRTDSNNVELNWRIPNSRLACLKLLT